jgi:hypothetical protein
MIFRKTLMKCYSVYGEPAYSEIQTMLHIRLEELRVQYGDSDELNQKFLQEFLDN